jgi:hypothetical protein
LHRSIDDTVVFGIISFIYYVVRTETHCGICQNLLPDWKAAVFANILSVPKQVPVIRVNVNGKGYLIGASPGQDGMVMFQAAVRKLCKVDGISDFNVCFDCKIPNPSGNYTTPSL